MIISELRPNAPKCPRPLSRARQSISGYGSNCATRATRRIAAFAAEAAGTSLDLDDELEAAGIEHLLKTGKGSK